MLGTFILQTLRHKDGAWPSKARASPSPWSWADTGAPLHPSPTAATPLEAPLTLRLGVVEEGVLACFWEFLPE